MIGAIAVLSALPDEQSHLANLMVDTVDRTVAGFSFVEGTIDGHPVVLAGAGMGKVNAGVVTTLLLDRFGCSAVIFSGVAGGLDPDLSIGDVVVADRVLQYDAGIIENEKLTPYQPGHVRFFNPTDDLGYTPPAQLLGQVKEKVRSLTLAALPSAAGGRDQPPRITFGTVLTGDAYLHCAATRGRLHSELSGSAIEMEGGAVAQVCETFGVPWLVVRALSDLAGREPDMDFTLFIKEVSAASAQIVRALLTTMRP